MWPFKKKRQAITVDVAASVLADEIKLCIEPYTIALDRFANTRNNDDELKQLLGEIWIFQIALLDYLWSLVEYSGKLRDKILPMIVVGYAKVDHKHYISRSHYYGQIICNVGSEVVPLVAGNALAELLETEYLGYKEKNVKKLFSELIGALALETIKKLNTVSYDLQAKYEIIQ